MVFLIIHPQFSAEPWMRRKLERDGCSVYEDKKCSGKRFSPCTIIHISPLIQRWIVPSSADWRWEKVFLINLEIIAAREKFISGKTVLTSSQILSNPDFNQPFLVMTDSSLWCRKDPEEVCIDFWSHSMSWKSVSIVSGFSESGSFFSCWSWWNIGRRSAQTINRTDASTMREYISEMKIKFTSTFLKLKIFQGNLRVGCRNKYWISIGSFREFFF